METSARLTGYLSLMAILFLAAIAGGFIHREANNPSRLIRVHFPEIGALMPDDPVTQYGVPVGTVRSIASNRNNPNISWVELELFHRGFLAGDSRFVDFNSSPMGNRSIVLVPGHSSRAMNEGETQEGLFAPSIVETIHKVDNLLEEVVGLERETSRLFTSPDAPFASVRVRRKLETALDALNRWIARTDAAEKNLRLGADLMVHSGKAMDRNFRMTQAALNPLWRRTQNTLGTATGVENTIDTALASVEKLLAVVQDTGSGLHGLLYDRQTYDAMESSLQALQSALHTLQTNGLDGIIQFRRNVHLHRRKSP